MTAMISYTYFAQSSSLWASAITRMSGSVPLALTRMRPFSPSSAPALSTAAFTASLFRTASLSSTRTFYGGTVGANLFNNNFSRVVDSTHRIILTTANLPLEVNYDFGVGTVVSCYNMYCGPDAGNRRPTEWEFYGSDDKTTWTLLDARRNMIWPGDTQITRAFAFENTTAYRYYRFKGIKGNTDSYFEMVQLEYFGPAPGELHLDVPAGATLINDEVKFIGYMKLVK